MALLVCSGCYLEYMLYNLVGPDLELFYSLAKINKSSRTKQTGVSSNQELWPWFMHMFSRF